MDQDPKHFINTSIELSLLIGRDQTLRVPERSGINWGQRPKREKNQAYIPIPARIQKMGFFPKPGRPFTITFDDGMKFICIRAQANGKALETPGNNALLGEYLRLRAGIPSGALVKLQHLKMYGRHSILFRKVGEDSFLADFSPIK